MDLQSVLQIPQAEASPFYYKRKLCVYNFTVYNEATREGNCYIWSEIDGKRGSNEIGSCVKRFIEGLTEKRCRKVILWSDNCSGQNRNRYIAAMLLQLVQESAVEIVEQNFLEVGHTQMDVDSMHSAIEHSAKNCSIFSMNDWSNIIRQARRKHPYNVVRMLHSDFIDLKSVNARSMKKVIVFENGEKLNWLMVKSLIFLKSMPGQIGIKYSHDEEEYKFVNVGVRKSRGRPAINNWPLLYKNLLPISDAKKRDLQSLCAQKLIPQEFHPWIDSLPVGNQTIESDSESENN